MARSSRSSTLSQEDLARWRLVTADKELVDGVFPGISVEEARRILLQYYKTMGDLFIAYGESGDEGGAVYLSPIDGSFYRLSSLD